MRILICLILMSCGEPIDKKSSIDDCQSSKDHFRACLGYVPYYECDKAKALEILNTPCEELENLWR
tara:strand:- start:138 stop:335 length:198 start_codon:yes stop_codon:yes gene_type:complete